MRRPLLFLLLASIAVNAALGIVALVSGDFGELERDVLFTSLCVSGTGVLSLACLPALERGRLGLLPRVGIAASVVGFGLLIVSFWIDDLPESYLQATQTVLVPAVAVAWASLIGLAHLARRFRWVLAVAIALVLVLGGQVVGAVWGGGDSDAYGRSVGVVAVLLAAFTLLVPILHRVSRAELGQQGAGEAGIRFCPGCGRPLVAPGMPGDALECARCGLGFSVTVSRSEPPGGD